MNHPVREKPSVIQSGFVRLFLQEVIRCNQKSQHIDNPNIRFDTIIMAVLLLLLKIGSHIEMQPWLSGSFYHSYGEHGLSCDFEHTASS